MHGELDYGSVLMRRRDALWLVGGGATSLVAAACVAAPAPSIATISPPTPVPTAEPTRPPPPSPPPTPTLVPTSAPTAPPTEIPAPTPTPVPTPEPVVSTQRALLAAVDDAMQRNIERNALPGG